MDDIRQSRPMGGPPTGTGDPYSQIACVDATEYGRRCIHQIRSRRCNIEIVTPPGVDKRNDRTQIRPEKIELEQPRHE